MGVKVVISLDAHDADDFDNLPFGVSTARKGWLERGDVMNCLTAAGFAGWLEKRREARGVRLKA